MNHRGHSSVGASQFVPISGIRVTPRNSSTHVQSRDTLTTAGRTRDQPPPTIRSSLWRAKATCSVLPITCAASRSASYSALRHSTNSVANRTPVAIATLRTRDAPDGPCGQNIAHRAMGSLDAYDTPDPTVLADLLLVSVLLLLVIWLWARPSMVRQLRCRTRPAETARSAHQSPGRHHRA